MFAMRNTLNLRYLRKDFIINNYIGVVSLDSFYLGNWCVSQHRGSYALILLIYKYFLMRNTEKTTKEQTSVTNFETQLAYWLDSFDGHLECLPKAQQLLHDYILILNEKVDSEKEKEVLFAFLNSALSLTFILKDNPNDVQKFINYKTNK